MIIWIDAQLSPYLASWLFETFGIEALALRDIELHEAKDREIYFAARDAGAVIMTKDSDFLFMQERLGPPPQVLWITCGNTSNAYLKGILADAFPVALELLAAGEGLVEISDAR